jgi:hypothetical protein
MQDLDGFFADRMALFRDEPDYASFQILQDTGKLIKTGATMLKTSTS